MSHTNHPKLLGAQLGEMVARDWPSTLVGIPAVLTVVWMHHGHLANSLVYGWMLYMFTVMGLRNLLGVHWKAVQGDASRWASALKWRMIFSAFYGLGWGGSMLILNTYSLDVLTTFKVGTLTATVGIILTSLSVIFRVFMAFLIPCWSALIIYIFFESGYLTPEDAWISGFAVTVFAGVVIGASLSHAKMARIFFLSKFELDEALAETRASHERETEMSRKLAEQARRDSLTGAYNRRYLAEQLDGQINLFKRSGLSFSVVMLDIDFFKRINDQFGHDVGDEVLKRVTHLMTEALREIDIFGRWGGEEFLCILPNTNDQDAARCAERLRASLEEIRFDAYQNGLRVTASFGVATSINDDDVDDLIKRCDLALYQAKSAGRNCVVAQ